MDRPSTLGTLRASGHRDRTVKEELRENLLLRMRQDTPLFPDLVGFGPVPADRRLDLSQVFDLPGRPPAQRAKRLDGRLATSLIGLPEQVTGAVDTAAYRSLAARDLLRGETTGLPSGEAVAGLLGVAPLSADELEQTWPHGTPLWFYILKEAEHRGGGDPLGPVGGRIVAEVLIGLYAQTRRAT